MQRILVTIALTAQVMMLCGCETPKQVVRYVPTSEPFCAAVKRVCIDKDDVFTPPTATQLKANEAGRSKVCKPQPEDECKPKKPVS